MQNLKFIFWLFLLKLTNQCSLQNLYITKVISNIENEKTVLRLGFNSPQKCSNLNLQIKTNNFINRKSIFNFKIEIFNYEITYKNIHIDKTIMDNQYYIRHVYEVEFPVFDFMKNFHYEILQDDKLVLKEGDFVTRNIEHSLIISNFENLEDLQVQVDNALLIQNYKNKESKKITYLILLGNFMNYDQPQTYEKFDQITTILEPLMKNLITIVFKGYKENQLINNFFRFRFNQLNQSHIYNNDFLYISTSTKLMVFINPVHSYQLYIDKNYDQLNELELFLNKMSQHTKFENHNFEVYTGLPLLFINNDVQLQYLKIATMRQRLENILSLYYPNFIVQGGFPGYQRFNNQIFQTQNNILNDYRDRKSYHPYFILVGGNNFEIPKEIEDVFTTQKFSHDFISLPQQGGMLQIGIDNTGKFYSQLFNKNMNVLDGIGGDEVQYSFKFEDVYSLQSLFNENERIQLITLNKLKNFKTFLRFGEFLFRKKQLGQKYAYFLYFKTFIVLINHFECGIWRNDIYVFEKGNQFGVIQLSIKNFCHYAIKLIITSVNCLNEDQQECAAQAIKTLNFKNYLIPTRFHGCLMITLKLSKFIQDCFQDGCPPQIPNKFLVSLELTTISMKTSLIAVRCNLLSNYVTIDYQYFFQIIKQTNIKGHFLEYSKQILFAQNSNVKSNSRQQFKMQTYQYG